ncbi:glycosyltransferase [Nocardioides sp.]|uniref:glycosyltransferase family 2 protein n=1 Tax=Nocardioides sp. TaxID=35761 RepID=UPI00271E0C63|nr:glycosyltransferase [Nocardioides sp.]MDO9457474.1 glycosyltransferase [Nocardioides sp.]
MRLRRRAPRISVVLPVYDVEAYLPACLDSVLASTWGDLEVVVVDDGSTDGSGVVADDYAARDPRVRVVHTGNRGLGAARNEGLRHTTGSLVTFADSDDAVPSTAYGVLHHQLDRAGCDFVTGSIAWWHPELAGTDDAEQELVQPPWMRRLHASRNALVIDQEPELLGDVFAWNKLFRRDFWDGAGLSWLEGHRYEDQPTTTDAYLRARRFGIVPDVVYHWRIRSDGTSITQQRASLDDLGDRWATKRMARQSVLDYGSSKVTEVFQDKVLPGDLHRYFLLIPDADDEWYRLLESGVREFFGTRSLVHSGLQPAQRLTGWLVQNGRREEAALVMSYVAAMAPGTRVPRVRDTRGVRIDVPGIDPRTVDHAALAVRDHEA